MYKPVAVVVALLVVGGVFPSAHSEESTADKNRKILQEAVAYPGDKAKVDAFIATLVEVPPGSGRYLVEGDLPLAHEEISSYLKGVKYPEKTGVRSQELVVNLVGGRFDYLVTPAKRHLTYTFDQSSFPSSNSFETVRQNFRKAADDWIAACPQCGITFTETVAPGAFVIRYENIRGGPIAQGFFPSTVDRTLRIFPEYFQSDLEFDPVGVLRHEIGHILGYRHEHIQNIPGCFTEGTDWLPLTPYTPNSVMHYFCGGRGSFDLSLRENDKKGHRCLYLTGKSCPAS
jgi:hypothetical protein